MESGRFDILGAGQAAVFSGFHPFLKPEHPVKAVVTVIIVDFAGFGIVRIGVFTVEELDDMKQSF